MSDQVQFNNAVDEVNEGVEEEVHSIEDMANATDFELKHTPNIQVKEEANGQLVKVSIGLNGIAHPQTEEHFIEWIRLFVGSEPAGEVKFGPVDTPVAEFHIQRNDQEVIAQDCCNLHGIWEARI
jgi:desulfoferrodoxin-like iron-binding protein